MSNARHKLFPFLNLFCKIDQGGLWELKFRISNLCFSKSLDNIIISWSRAALFFLNGQQPTGYGFFMLTFLKHYGVAGVYVGHREARPVLGAWGLLTQVDAVTDKS